MKDNIREEQEIGQLNFFKPNWTNWFPICICPCALSYLYILFPNIGIIVNSLLIGYLLTITLKQFPYKEIIIIMLFLYTPLTQEIATNIIIGFIYRLILILAGVLIGYFTLKSNIYKVITESGSKFAVNIKNINKYILVLVTILSFGTIILTFLTQHIPYSYLILIFLTPSYFIASFALVLITPNQTKWGTLYFLLIVLLLAIKQEFSLDTMFSFGIYYYIGIFAGYKLNKLSKRYQE